ncbi:MAG: nitrate reductase molybdenum cofactor assembly chaperone [Armatimonadota bacterium]
MTCMIADDIQIYRALGTLFDYPTDEYPAHILACREQLRSLHPAAARALEAFQQQMARLEPGEREELYTGTFDLAPVCVPYVSVHLFGAENYRRGELMARLNEEYASREFTCGPELPDHLGVLLRFLPSLSREEQRELIHYCLREPVQTMIGLLAKSANPYRHLLRAVQLALEAAASKEDSHA